MAKVADGIGIDGSAEINAGTPVARRPKRPRSQTQSKGGSIYTRTTVSVRARSGKVPEVASFPKVPSTKAANSVPRSPCGPRSAARQRRVASTGAGDSTCENTASPQASKAGGRALTPVFNKIRPRVPPTVAEVVKPTKLRSQSARPNLAVVPDNAASPPLKPPVVARSLTAPRAEKGQAPKTCTTVVPHDSPRPASAPTMPRVVARPGSTPSRAATPTPTAPSAPAVARRPNTAPFKGRIVSNDAVKAPPGDRPKSSGHLGRRPTFRSATGTSSSLARQTDGLDSDSSDDDEAEALRRFWQQLRNGGLGDSMPSVDSKLSSTWPGVNGPKLDNAKATGRRPPTAPLQQSNAGRRGTVGASACWQTRPLTPTPRCVSPGVGAYGSPSKRRPLGAKLWRWPTDVHMEVLCFLELECLCELGRTCTVLRQAGSMNLHNTWRLITPHLQLCSRDCETQLEHVWLPCTRWLEARDLKVKSCRTLFSFFELPEPRTARCLVSLDLRNTKLASELSLLGVVRTCGSLRDLDLSRTRLKDHGGCLLLRGLVFDPHSGDCAPHRCLQHLALEENGFTEAIADDLAGAARNLPLETLLLARNELGDGGARAMAGALADKTSLYRGRVGRLDLSENQLTAVGLAAVLGSLGSNLSLRRLDVGGNELIGGTLFNIPETGQEVTLGLESASELREFHLWRCGLSDAACQLVVDAQPPTISLLNLAANPFSQELRNRLIRQHEYGASVALRL